MLRNDFYTLNACHYDGQRIEAVIKINPAHVILKAHFPEQAVVPGVCMLEMQKEILESVLHVSLRLDSASVIKYLHVFTPEITTEALYTIQVTPVEDAFQINASLMHQEILFYKFQGLYTQR